MDNHTTTKEISNFLHNVTWLRKHHGISKKRMAQLLGIGIGSLNKIESGEFPPQIRITVFYNIHRYFGIKPSDLVGKRLDETDPSGQRPGNSPL